MNEQLAVGNSERVSSRRNPQRLDANCQVQKARQIKTEVP